MPHTEKPQGAQGDGQDGPQKSAHCRFGWEGVGDESRGGVTNDLHKNDNLLTP